MTLNRIPGQVPRASACLFLGVFDEIFGVSACVLLVCIVYLTVDDCLCEYYMGHCVFFSSRIHPRDDVVDSDGNASEIREEMLG